MYKVFIENKALHIIEGKEFIPKDAIIVYEDDIESIRKPIFQLLNSEIDLLPVYLVSPNVETTFSDFFEGFDFIEAAGGIVKRNKSFLFIKRNGLWDIPKGKIEKKEKPQAAAIREVEEECGIVNPKIERLIGITYHTYFCKDRPTIKKTYWYAMTYNGSKELIPQKEEGISKVEWLKWSELKKVRKNTFSSILEVMDLYF